MAELFWREADRHSKRPVPKVLQRLQGCASRFPDLHVVDILSLLCDRRAGNGEVFSTPLNGALDPDVGIDRNIGKRSGAFCSSPRTKSWSPLSPST
jgi:hypothetical protein